MRKYSYIATDLYGITKEHFIWADTKKEAREKLEWYWNSNGVVKWSTLKWAD